MTTVYAATKAFVLNFTEVLWQESLGTGLRVMALPPSATRTGFNDVLGTEEPTSGASFQTPRQVVETALRALDRRTPPNAVKPPDGERGPVVEPASRGAGSGAHDEGRKE